MKLNTSERLYVEKLSRQLNGTSSAYRHILKAAKVPGETVNTGKYYKYLKNSKKGGLGTRIRVTSDNPAAVAETRTTYAELSYPQLVEYMERALEMRDLNKLTPSERSFVVAFLATHNRLRNHDKVVLGLDKADQADFDTAFSQLESDALKLYVTDSRERLAFDDSVVLPAAKFVLDLVFNQNFPKDAAELAAKYTATLALV